MNPSHAGAADPDSPASRPDRDRDSRDDRLDGRSETPTERADRNWSDIMQELRSVQTGTQLITGFLLAVAFQPAFADLENYERLTYLVLVVLAGLATLLGLAPVIIHRRLFGRRQKARLVKVANRFLIAHLVVVSLLAAGVTSLIFDVAVGRTAGFVVLAIALVAVVLLWFLVPRMTRRTEDDPA